MFVTYSPSPYKGWRTLVLEGKNNCGESCYASVMHLFASVTLRHM